MQRLSFRMKSTIEALYTLRGLDINSTINAKEINYSMHNVFTTFFKVSLQGDEVEVPLFAMQCAQDILSSRPSKDNSDSTRSEVRKDIIIRFNTISRTPSYRTADTLIRALTWAPLNNTERCVTVKTVKGEKYYGCNGAIFNKDMAPLILNVIVCKIINSTLVYKKVRSYIHPSVFYSDGTIEQCISKKVIPYIMQNGARRYLASRAIDNIVYVDDSTIPELIVADVMDKFLCKPVLPSTTYSNDDINDMLDRNANDVFNVLQI